MNGISKDSANQIIEILTRRSNEIASFKQELEDMPGSVDLALSREIERLRKLAEELEKHEIAQT